MRKINLSIKDFSVINDDSIEKYESYTPGIFVTIISIFLSILVTISVLHNRKIIELDLLLFVLLLVVIFVIRTRLFKYKVEFNRKDKLVTTYFLNKRNKRVYSYFEIFDTHRIVSPEGSEKIFYLTNYRVDKDSLKISEKKILKFSNYNFVKELEAYMFYKRDEVIPDLEIQLKNSKIPDQNINLFYLMRGSFLYNQLNDLNFAKEDVLTVIYNLKILLSHSPKQSLILAESYEILGRIYKAQGELDKAVDKLFLASSYAKQIQDLRGEYYVSLLSELAKWYLQLGDSRQAKSYFDEAFEIDGNPENGLGLFLCYLMDNELDKAEGVILEAYNSFYDPKYLLVALDFYVATGQKLKGDELLENSLNNIYYDEAVEELEIINNYKKNYNDRVITVEEIIKRELVSDS